MNTRQALVLAATVVTFVALTASALSAWRDLAHQTEQSVQAAQAAAVSSQAARLGSHLAMLEATATSLAANPKPLRESIWSTSSGVGTTGGQLRFAEIDAGGGIVIDSGQDSLPTEVRTTEGLAWALIGSQYYVVAGARRPGGGHVLILEAAESYSELLRAPWSWVVAPDGRILAHADPSQIGTRPFDTDADDPALTAMREEMAAGQSGSRTYVWVEPETGATDTRMASYTPVIGAPAGWAIGTSESQDDVLGGVLMARRRTAAFGASLVVTLLLGALTIINWQREARRREREHSAERLALTQAAAHGERLALLGTLTAGVAHDLRGPLTAIRTLTELLADCDDPDESDDLVIDLDEAITTLSDMVSDLTGFARTRGGRCEDPGSAVELAERMLRARFRHAVELSVHNDPDLPALDLDSRRLTQALLNLAINAEQAGADTIALRTVATDAYTIEFQVDDNGHGVPLALRDKLFQPFFTTKADGEGTGLGLHLVHTLATEAGGEVDIQDSNLGGARFIIRVPVPFASEDAEPASRAA